MRLIETPDNPAPPGAIVSMASAVDGAALRVALWRPTTEPIGTLSIFPGRAEFIEKYFETVTEALARGFIVTVMDWRGQGLSTRQIANRRKGHIDDFSVFERDIDALVRQTLEPFCPKPWFALGHSMGGAILLMNAQSGRSPFELLALTAPMIDIWGIRLPRAGRLLAESLDALGFGGAFVPFGKADSVMSKPFEGNVLTGDPRRYARSAAVLAADADLGLGDPTIGWAHAAFRLIDQFADAEYPRRILTPTLIFSAGDDHVVDARAVERFAARLKAGRAISLTGARHEILMERNSIRDLFWAGFDAFIPGTAQSEQEAESVSSAPR